MLKKFTMREKAIIGMTIGLLIIAVYFNFYLSGVLNKYYNLKGEIQNYSQKLKRYKETDVSKVTEKLGDMSQKIDILKKELPDEERDFEIVREVKEISDRTNVIIKEISFGNSEENKDIDKISLKLYNLPVNLLIMGNYNDVVNFINNIESNQRIGIINRCSIRKSQNNIFDAEISLNYFILKP